jgi:hypothetical protein
MPSNDDRISTPSEPAEPRNAFDRRFLNRLDEHDEPPHAGEADTAGPWNILEVPGRGFGLFREGEDPARGYRPYAVFHDRWLALIAAAVLPGTGRDPFVHLDPEAGPEGFDFLLDDGEVVGQCECFDQPFCDAIHAVVSVLRSPLSLAHELEAAGSITLDRSGAILDARVAAQAPAAP